ncbi:hypothetical protein ACOME3_003975 [Neoechinorhynchus agilis]
MKKLSHDRLVSLHALCFNTEPFYIVMEYMEGGSLLDYIRQERAKKEYLFENMVYSAAQIIDGMVYLESEDYVHADLAARNILIDRYRNVKIADFGLTRIVSTKERPVQTVKGGIFAVKWAAPEVILSVEFSSKSDVWSFAVTMFEILSYGNVPYESVPHKSIISKLLNGYRLPKPKICSKKLYEVMMDCWHLKPEDRPSFAKLRSLFDTIIDLHFA